MNDIAHLAGVGKRMVVSFPFEMHVQVRLVHFVYNQNKKGNVSYQRHFKHLHCIVTAVKYNKFLMSLVPI